MKPIPKRTLIPVLTDLLEYRKASQETIPYARDMVDRYGDVCNVSFTGIRNYFIHDPEVIKEILTTQSPKFKRSYLFVVFRKFLGNGLFTSDGDDHRAQRRLIKPAFYPQRIEGYAGIMVSCAEEEMDTWKDGETININKAMTRITLKVITRTMFGAGISNKFIEDAGKNLAEAFGVLNKILMNPLYTWCLEKEIKIPLVKRFFLLKEELDQMIKPFISAARSDHTTQRFDLLSILMEARDEESGKGMSDEQIRDEVVTFFIAGHETTTLALSWTWYLLGKNPDVASSLYDEVRKKITGRLPEASDYQALSHTKNIFRESLRLYPPAWTFAREAKEDVVLKDYHFPKGSVLWTITYLIHHSEKYFERPEEFLPGRWEEEKMKDLPKYAYFPFGGGNRMCIGEGFAWMEGILVLATIAKRFRLTLPKGFTTEINPLFSLKMKKDVVMKAEKWTSVKP